MTDRLHDMLIERANREATKRIKDKQKRFGKLHDIEEDLVKRAEVQRQNSAALVALMLEYNFLIPAKSFPLWRPTLRVRGMVNGVHEGLEIIATDGILGWFVTHEGVAWLGHIQHFTGKIEPLYSFHGQMASKTKVKRPRKKSKRQQLIDSL